MLRRTFVQEQSFRRLKYKVMKSPELSCKEPWQVISVAVSKGRFFFLSDFDL